MAAKDLKNTRRLKQFAPALVAGATIFGVTSAIAGFTAIIKDADELEICNVEKLEQDESGIKVILENGETCFNNLTDYGDTDSIRFSAYDDAQQKDINVAGCSLSKLSLSSNGKLIISTDGNCVLESVDYKCYVENEQAFVLNVIYDQDAVCDDRPMDTRAKSVTAGNVTVNANVEFKTRTNGTIRLLPQFTVASNHIFRASTNPTS